MRTAPKVRTLRDVDPAGRVDVALLRLGEQLTRRTLEPACGGAPLWDRGLGDVVEALIEENPSIPSRAFTAVDLARAVGVLPPAKRRAK